MEEMPNPEEYCLYVYYSEHLQEPKRPVLKAYGPDVITLGTLAYDYINRCCPERKKGIEISIVWNGRIQ
jgi:hypothetical protein